MDQTIPKRERERTIMKVVRIIASVLLALAGAALFIVTVFSMIRLHSNLIYISAPFLIIGMVGFIVSGTAQSRRAKVGMFLIAPFILLILAEVFNGFVYFVTMGIIPVPNFPAIDPYSINSGITVTYYIVTVCIAGLVFSIISKRGNRVINLIAVLCFVLAELLIVIFNRWFVSTLFLIAWITYAVALIVIVATKGQYIHVQKMSKETKPEAKKDTPVVQNQAAKTEGSPKTKRRVWEENGFVYTNLP